MWVLLKESDPLFRQRHVVATESVGGNVDRLQVGDGLSDEKTEDGVIHSNGQSTDMGT